MEPVDQPEPHRKPAMPTLSMPVLRATQGGVILEEKSRLLAQAIEIGRAVLDAATDAILAVDDEGQVTQYNQRYAELLQTPVDVLDKGLIDEVWHYAARNFADPAAFGARVREISGSSEESFDLVETCDHRMLERFSKVLKIEDGRTGRVWRFRDVTDRNAAEITSRQLAAIVTSSDDAIISKDLHSIITSWNDSAERIFGYRAEEMIGTSIMRLIPEERQAEELDIVSRIQKGERYEHFETVRVAKDGRRIDLSITVSPIKDAKGRVIGASKIARDISGAKEAARQVAEAMARAEALSQEREQLLESEREARSRAERTGRVKDEFLATLSHELRTPLNAVLGWVNILRSEKCEGAELEEGLVIIERNARAQTQIIEDLLDMSRIISGKVRLDAQTINVAAVLNESIDTVRATAAAKGVRLEVSLELNEGYIAGDPHRMQQVFWNLLSNAIKFTPKLGEVRVCLRRVGEDLEVAVADTGEGIAPEFLPYVFDRFQQADSSSTRRHGGLGLGLAIVKQLIEMHGGRVAVASEGRGRGAAFTMRLPMILTEREGEGAQGRKPEEIIRDCESSHAVGLDGMHVLVVDDEPDAREFVKRLMTRSGAQVSQAGSVTEAMEEIASRLPDVIVCDIGMPGEDGYSLIRRIRNDNRSRVRTIPALALTAYARAEDRSSVIRAGFQNHLAKPVDAAELLAIVAGLRYRSVVQE